MVSESPPHPNIRSVKCENLLILANYWLRKRVIDELLEYHGENTPLHHAVIQWTFHFYDSIHEHICRGGSKGGGHCDELTQGGWHPPRTLKWAHHPIEISRERSLPSWNNDIFSVIKTFLIIKSHFSISKIFFKKEKVSKLIPKL